MRARNAGAMVRLVLILALAAGTMLSSVALDGVPSAPPPDSAAVQAKAKSQKQDKGKEKKPGKDGHGKKNGGGKGKKHKSKKTPAALDIESIAAKNADTVAAFDCTDLQKIRVGDRTYCTHGEDPQMFGASDAEGETAASARSSGAAPRALCIDNGQSGPRVQLIYVHRNDHADRLGELLPTFRRLAAEMDTIFDQSARKTGDSLRVRFVTNGQCQVDIDSAGVPANAMGGFGSMIGKLKEAGYDRIDRKYLILADTTSAGICGIASFAYADAPNTKAHNYTGYARVDKACWDAGTMAHELSHTLGAVQYSAPNTSRGAHCIDEWDVMCYSDEPHKPKMKFFCEDGAGEFRLDCRDDDYFAAEPAAGSYLARHWNMAGSIYLAEGSGETCVDAAREPDDAFWYDYWGVPFPTFDVGESAERAFCEEPGDTDWILFEGKRGKSYQIETTDLGPDVDTQLVAYRGFKEQHWGGMDQMAVNDDREEGDPSSSITFTAPRDSTYLIGISEADERAGFDKTYTLSVEEVPTTGTGALTLSRNSAKPQGPFTATMRELTPAATVTFWWERSGNATELGQETADDDGIAAGNYTVPKGAKKGSYQVEAIATDSSFASATLRVEERDGKQGKAGKHKGKGKGKGKGGKKGKKGKRGKH